MYFTSGDDRAFEQLMQERPGADHFTTARPERRRIAAPAAFIARTGSISFASTQSVPTSRASSPPLTAR